MQSGQALQENKKGFQKIQMCCHKAKTTGLEYVWVDTCCIDKTSSSELQEAINSMFQWYRNAVICYAYLFDVQIDSDNTLSSSQSFQDSVWFKRGWTLQELLAPTEMVFYGEGWHELGDKHLLKHELSAATGISLSVLEGKIELQDISIAERMSWASERKTERVEDRAYSLLGIFDVSMPMLYGEGKKAFRRLQEEIIKYSDDHTIFAWKGMKHKNPGMLALEPDDFASCQNLVNVRVRKGRNPYSVTNRGLSITLSLKPWTIDTYLAVIYCDKTVNNNAEKDSRQNLMGIFLRRLDDDDQYARVSVSAIELMTIKRSSNGASLPGFRDVTVNVRQVELPNEEFASVAEERVSGFRISDELLEYDSKGKRLFEIKGNLTVGREKPNETTPGREICGIVGKLDISKQKRRIEVITLGFDFEFNPVCFLAESSGYAQKGRMFDKSGKFAINGDWDLTPEEVHNSKGIHERTPEDVMGWNSIMPDGTALVNAGRSGLWALKGDRLKGLDVSLRPYSMTIEENIRVTMTRESIDGQMGWVFGIIDTTKSIWRKPKGEDGKDGRRGFAKFM
ncbi:hypothetical protein MMC34_004528 [Xylographa carneopallida]|nr:hypothetical protein [Xylographa carneopallida]